MEYLKKFRNVLLVVLVFYHADGYAQSVPNDSVPQNDSIPMMSLVNSTQNGTASLLESKLLNYVPISPSAAELTKRINEPVDYCSGSMNLSIPLYVIKTKDFVLPINLNCNTTGIKVADIQGVVGLGWSLEAEPMVSREVRGPLADEEGGGYLTYNSLFGSNDKNYIKVVLERGYDEMPDIYYFKTLDNSGRFIPKRPLSQAESGKFNPIMLPASPEKIYADNLSSGLQIKDKYGNLYTYGQTRASREETWRSNQTERSDRF